MIASTGTKKTPSWNGTRPSQSLSRFRLLFLDGHKVINNYPLLEIAIFNFSLQNFSLSNYFTFKSFYYYYLDSLGGFLISNKKLIRLCQVLSSLTIYYFNA